jgi:hypothetical protein
VRLASITVENYRSITKAHRIPISDLTVLVGPNNEGKSNILRALVTAMNVLTGQGLLQTRAGPSSLHGRFQGHSRIYDWDTDFPVHLQEAEPEGESIIGLNFQPTAEELAEFKTTIGSNLKGNLPLRIALGHRTFSVSVVSKGAGGPALTKKSAAIAKFVAERLEFGHIPAVRTAGSAERIVTDLVDRELRKLDGNPEFIQALNKIAELQQPLLDELSGSLKQTLVKFLPRVTAVSVSIPQMNRNRAMRNACEITVDDGTPTLLEYKGDGVQSLAALALMRHAAESSAEGKHLVIAIEEPESHLHSSAIHEIRGVLTELSKKHQVVLTTHNPLFVDRGSPKSNILVTEGRARPAKSVDEIRDCLGVRAADNLRHAELVIVVEGEDDLVALSALLRESSASLRAALDGRSLALDALSGAGNLSYKLGLLRAGVCATHCVLDDDLPAHTAFKRAEDEGLASVADTHFMTCPGRKEAELEDLYDPAVYESVLQTKFGVTLGPKTKAAAKWSDRMAEIFKRNGKPWSDATKADVKAQVARAIAANPGTALLKPCRSAFDALVTALEKRLADMRDSAST